MLQKKGEAVCCACGASSCASSVSASLGSFTLPSLASEALNEPKLASMARPALPPLVAAGAEDRAMAGALLPVTCRDRSSQPLALLQDGIGVERVSRAVHVRHLLARWPHLLVVQCRHELKFASPHTPISRGGQHQGGV